MPRTAEAGLIVAASGLATLGVVLVGLAAGTGFDARAGLTFLMFLIAFGGLHLAIGRQRQTPTRCCSRWPPCSAPSGSPWSTGSTRLGQVCSDGGC